MTVSSSWREVAVSMLLPTLLQEELQEGAIIMDMKLPSCSLDYNYMHRSTSILRHSFALHFHLILLHRSVIVVWCFWCFPMWRVHDSSFMLAPARKAWEEHGMRSSIVLQSLFEVVKLLFQRESRLVRLPMTCPTTYSHWIVFLVIMPYCSWESEMLANGHKPDSIDT